jgi:hypothetical protein
MRNLTFGLMCTTGLALISQGCAAETIDDEDLAVEAIGTQEEMALTGSGAWQIYLERGGTVSAWGDGNAPDLYVKRYCGGAYRNRSATIHNDYTPEWFELLLSAHATDGYVKSCYLELWEHDKNPDDYIGKANLNEIAQEAIERSPGMWAKKTYQVNGNVPSNIVVKMRRF